MPIPLPNLDDRTYAELTAEARSLIPTVLPGWTNHNPSDPGIALVELLAWLTEMLFFQVNEIPEPSTEGFLRLLNGPGWVRPAGSSLEDVIFATIGSLREPYRAATADDLEHLAMVVWPSSEAAQDLAVDLAQDLGEAPRIARVRAVPRRDLAATVAAVRADPAPAHLSLVVVPVPAGDRHPQPPAELLTALADFLAPRRTLTTRLHVVGPRYVDLGVTARLALHDGAVPGDTLAAAHRALATFFDPFVGGPEGTGWPFGRSVHASEVYATLEQVALVDYVDDVQLATVKADASDLVRLARVDLTAYDRTGEPYPYEAGAS